MKNEFVIVNVRIDRVKPNPYQTRLSVDQEYIRQLADDILAHDLLEVPAGRRVDADGVPVEWGLNETDIQLAYGHNRLAAFQLLNAEHEGYGSIPVKIVAYSDEQMAMAAWSENEKRKQLNPVERATAIKNFMQSFSWTHAEVAEKLSMERSTVTNLLRLFKLPEEVLDSISDGTLSQRQATALIPYYELTSGERNRLLTEFNLDEGLLSNFDDFITDALDGKLDSDTIRMRISKAITVIHPEPPQFEFESPNPLQEGGTIEGQRGEALIPWDAPALPAFDPNEERMQEQTVWLQKDIEGRSVAPVVAATDDDQEPEDERDEPAVPAGQQGLPIEPPAKMTTELRATGAPQIKSPHPPLNEGEQVTPKTWEESKYSITLGYLAVDGNPEGRLVMVSVRINQNPPILKMVRESVLTLPAVLSEIVDRWKWEMV